MHPGHGPAEAFRELVRPVSVFSSGFTTPFILLPLTAPSLHLLHSWTPKATEQGQSLMSVLEGLRCTLVLLILDLCERRADRNGLIFLSPQQTAMEVGVGGGGEGCNTCLKLAADQPAPQQAATWGGPVGPRAA